MSFLEILKTYWYLIIIGIIFALFLFFPPVAIIITVFFLVAIVLAYIPSFSASSRLIKYMSDYSTIEDAAIAHKLVIPLEEVQKKMVKLSKNQKKKKWLIVHLNARYIYYNENTIVTYRQLYYRGYTDRRIFEEMKRFTSIRTRSEIKAIELELIKHGRLEKRGFINKSDRMLPLYSLD